MTLPPDDGMRRRLDDGIDHAEDLPTSVRRLVAQGRSTSASVDRLEKAIGRQTRAIRWRTLALVVVLLVIGAVVLNNSAQIGASERKLCPMIGVLVPAPGEPSPSPGPHGTLSRSQVVANRAKALSKGYGCPAP
jgi:hypothetical protein